MSFVSADIIFVKADIVGGDGDGTSWENAFGCLQDALDAVAGTKTTLWVAAGTYLPQNEVGGSGDRYKAFQLRSGVSVYGGFAGNEDPETFSFDERNFEDNTTVLSGDLGSGTHVYHVFRHVDLGLDNTALLDGVTITGGRADGADEAAWGGGMLNYGTSSGLGSSPTIRQCMFDDNSAVAGGAMYNSRYSHPIVSHTIFKNNSATEAGGAVYTTRNTPVFNSCIFIDNTVDSSEQYVYGGALYFNAQTASEGLTLINGKFTDNIVTTDNASQNARARGGAVYAQLNPGGLVITNTSFIANDAQYGGGVYLDASSTENAENSTVQLFGLSFESNSGAYGAGLFVERHNATIYNCRFRGNSVSDHGAALYVRNGAAPVIANALMAGNKSDNYGGALYINAASPQLINCTISGNYAARGGGIAGIQGASCEVFNSIIWGNEASIEGNEMYLGSATTFTNEYSLYRADEADIYIASDAVILDDNAITTENPLFLGAVAPMANNTPNTEGNYFICCQSAAIDAGNNDFVPEDLTTDIRGGTRIFDGTGDGHSIVDIGAYEFLADACVALEPSSGDGSLNDPYEIETLQHLYWIAEDSGRWAYHYVQTADIDASITECWFLGAGWSPIGNNVTYFTGTYNAQGHRIYSLYINRPNTDYIGLFGRIYAIPGQSATVANLGLVDVDITGNEFTGGLVGRTEGVWNARAKITNSFVTGTVSGRGNTGGLCGYIAYRSYVANVYTRCDIIRQDYDWAVGGIAGSYYSQGGEIFNSYAASSISALGNGRGGITGQGTDLTTATFYDSDIINVSSTGIGKSTDEMTTLSTFTDADWDFDTIWAIDPDVNDGYPYLKGVPMRPYDATWDGGGDDNETTTGFNWDMNRHPLQGEFSIMRFAGTVRLTPEVTHPVDSAFGSILFMDNAGAFTLSGNGLSLYATLQNDSENEQTIAIPLTIAAPVTIAALNGPLTISGDLVGNENITKTGNQTLLLTGENTFSGATLVSAGTLGGVGSPESATTVQSGATLMPAVEGEIGTFYTAALTLQSGSRVAWDYDDTTADLIEVDGTLTLNDTVTIAVNKMGEVVNATHALFAFTGDDPDIDALAFDFTDAPGVTGATAFIEDNVVYVTLVPEPGGLVFVLFVAIGLRLRR